MKKYSLIIMLSFGLLISSVPNQTTNAQIPVTDVANLAQNALDYLESLAQTVQMYIDYELALEELAQVYLEWEATLYRIQSLSERFGEDPFKRALEKMDRKWGEKAIAVAIQSETGSGFIELTIGLLYGVLGGGPMEPEQIIDLTDFIQDDELRNTIGARLNVYSARDMALRDSMLGAAAVNEKVLVYQERFDALMEQAESLGANSDTATLQFIAMAQLFTAQQSMEQLDLQAKIFGNNHQATLMSNMDDLKQLELQVQKRKEHLESLDGSQKFQRARGQN